MNTLNESRMESNHHSYMVFFLLFVKHSWGPPEGAPNPKRKVADPRGTCERALVLRGLVRGALGVLPLKISGLKVA